MNVLALTIPLTTLLDLTNLCASTAARCPRFVLNTSADWQSLFTGDLGLRLVVFAHGSGFPLTDATSHELWTVGFSNIFPLDKDATDVHYAALVIYLHLAPSESCVQAK